MDGFKLQRWARARQLARELGIGIEIKGDRIRAFSEKYKTTCGVFDTVDELLSYVCGVEYGRSLGRVE